ncbi:MAG: hypothetical protein WBA98_03790 [Gordonia sp. (in: high G+C Gram-positive bacteria)]|uniref:hypothetical protein n=1 Tax=Gordonia sp. (in: high G+C Gram-positive bacteria) TaxID=84139 RepID=UPI003C77B886
MSTDKTKSKAKLRLAVARMFTASLRVNSDLREQLMSSSGWDQKSPIVPAEGDALYGEVHATALAALEDSPTGVVAVPVCMVKRSDESVEIRIHVLTVRTGSPAMDDYSSININDIAHNVTMEQVCETLAPKGWDLKLLEEDTKKLTAAYA